MSAFHILGLPDEDMLNICEKLETSDLESFMKSSQHTYDVCYYEWIKRHQSEFGKEHRFLTKEQRKDLKTCLKEYSKNKGALVLEIDRTADFNGKEYSNDFLRLLRKLYYGFGKIFDGIYKEYGEERAHELGIEWNEYNLIDLIDKAHYEYFSNIIDDIHSDNILLTLRDLIKEYATKEGLPIDPCLD